MSTLGSPNKLVQAAIYAVLNGDGTLTALAPVYDEPPEGNAFPYLLIGDVVESADNRMGGKSGEDLMLTIHAFSEQRSFDEVNDILSRVKVDLDNDVGLVVTGYTVNLFNHETTTQQREGLLRHGISVYRLNLVET